MSQKVDSGIGKWKRREHRFWRGGRRGRGRKREIGKFKNLQRGHYAPNM